MLQRPSSFNAFVKSNGVCSWMSIAMMLAIGIGVAGIRTPAVVEAADGAPVIQIETDTEKTQESASIHLKYIGRQSQLVIIVRPDAFHSDVMKLALESWQQVSDFVVKGGTFESLTHLPASELEQFTVCSTSPRKRSDRLHLYIVFNSKIDQTELAKENALKTEERDGIVYVVRDTDQGQDRLKGPIWKFGAIVDSKTSIWAQSEDHLEYAISVASATRDDRTAPDWIELIPSVSDCGLIMLHSHNFILRPGNYHQLANPVPELASMIKSWSMNGQSLAFGLQDTSTPEVILQLEFESPADAVSALNLANEAKSAWEATVRTMMDQLPESQKPFVEMGLRVLEGVESTINNNTLQLKAEANVDTTLLKKLLDATTQPKNQ